MHNSAKKYGGARMVRNELKWIGWTYTKAKGSQTQRYWSKRTRLREIESYSSSFPSSDLLNLGIPTPTPFTSPSPPSLMSFVILLMSQKVGKKKQRQRLSGNVKLWEYSEVTA